MNETINQITMKNLKNIKNDVQIFSTKIKETKKPEDSYHYSITLT
jgi:hypothetical protein